MGMVKKPGSSDSGKPKALRHAFGAEAALNQIALTLIKK
jgi:hypothetical protein